MQTPSGRSSDSTVISGPGPETVATTDRQTADVSETQCRSSLVRRHQLANPAGDSTNLLTSLVDFSRRSIA
jgi:hypothetical protein